ncbi:MAG: Phosphoribosylformylglycinamidine cyclo-ligase [Firmicutes bacterium]|nr:Phosphoribosylformylglycinamidine cyclo-ligase [Bacillota bacterium]MBT9157389.1 Phosphoribosylformylglycinamidine cyclo-ligase [Bacillota bacterium]
MCVDKPQGLTYKQAGVDVAAGNRAVKLIERAVRSTFRPEVQSDIGGFGGLFALGRYNEPILVSGTDGVGTKLKVAFMMNRHDTVGIDLVAMSVNDILVSGAEPLFFLDYIGLGRLDPEQVAAIVKGVAEGCREAGCALLGGETAEMPGFYQPGEYDLAGFAVGVVEKEQLVDGRYIKEGDVLLGLASSGLHSNGYSLARKIVFEVAKCELNDFVPALGTTVGEALLRPTRIYVQTVLPLARAGLIKGMVHITGGGFTENIPRVLGEGLGAEIVANNWPRPAIFSWLAELGQVAEEEMFRTFNMGIGFIMVVAAEDALQVADKLALGGETCYSVGRVVRGEGVSFCVWQS